MCPTTQTESVYSANLAKVCVIYTLTFPQAKRGWFSVDTAKISEYFSLGVCMEGLNTIFKSLYSVELQIETPAEGEIWNPDVYKIAVRDLSADGHTLGHIYCDFFSRPGKPHQGGWR